MGCFSWICSDTMDNLKQGTKAYVPFPKEKGGALLHERCYDGHGIFGGYDIYELVAIWNREFLSTHPEYIVPRQNRKISEYYWYPIYKDLLLSEKEVSRLVREQSWYQWFMFRQIGIDIACYDEDNAALPYPIKICKYKKNAVYESLLPSLGDLKQGRY